MGSKSAVIFVETDDVRILVDPGLSALQPGFPIPDSWKSMYNIMGYRMIEKFATGADIVIITHYHYDHHEPVDSPWINTRSLYYGKILLVKNPNKYINNSQFERARTFLGGLVSSFLGRPLEDFLEEPKERDFGDPIDWIPMARDKDFGDYNTRRRQILENGRKRFERLVSLWSENPWIREIDESSLKVRFADGMQYCFGKTKIKFTRPMFHGVEYDRLGWVIGFTVESSGDKLLYTSDIQGPFIEDYADWIISENPNIAVIDGPPTYQFGYMMTRTTLRRAIENMIRILESAETELIIWDHHLLRDVRWRERVAEVYKYARRKRKRLITAAEFYGKRPVAELANALRSGKRIRWSRYVTPPRELLQAK